MQNNDLVEKNTISRKKNIGISVSNGNHTEMIPRSPSAFLVFYENKKRKISKLSARGKPSTNVYRAGWLVEPFSRTSTNDLRYPLHRYYFLALRQSHDRPELHRCNLNLHIEKNLPIRTRNASCPEHVNSITRNQPRRTQYANQARFRKPSKRINVTANVSAGVPHNFSEPESEWMQTIRNSKR